MAESERKSIPAWASVYAALAKKEPASCPECGTAALRHRFIGDHATRLGYGYVWCPSCLRGIHLSRVEVPSHFELRDPAAPDELEGLPEISFVAVEW